MRRTCIFGHLPYPCVLKRQDIAPVLILFELVHVDRDDFFELRFSSAHIRFSSIFPTIVQFGLTFLLNALYRPNIGIICLKIELTLVLTSNAQSKASVSRSSLNSCLPYFYTLDYVLYCVVWSVHWKRKSRQFLANNSSLLLITNRKSHTRFRLVPKSSTLDDIQ